MMIRKGRAHMDVGGPPGGSTGTLAGARDHARAQESATAAAVAVTATSRTVPAGSARDLPAGVAPEAVVWDETVPGGGYAARHLARGALVRFTDLDGDAGLTVLVFNARHTMERLNVVDTVKVQWQAYLGTGAVLLSDMGRALMTIVADTSGRHDALCGTSNGRSVAARCGTSGIHSACPSGRDLLTVAAAKAGLSRRDLGPPLNLLTGVRVLPDGGLRWDGNAGPGAHVELRADLDVLVVLANTPHPLDDRHPSTVTPVRCTAWIGDPRAADATARTSTPERRRAFENTDDYLLSLGLGGATR
jgi:urea carboxylase-associated protein 2